jgi:hypothetical protein
MRRFLAVLLGLSALALSFGPSAPAEAGGSRHPYFNDGGALRWYHSFAEAKRVARAEGKVIFIESGRRRCSSCARLCSQVLASGQIRARLSKIAIGLASECDRPEREVQQLFRRHLPNPKLLPLCGFVTPDGRWIAGFWGGRSVSQFQGDLARAEAAWRRLNQHAAQPRTPNRRPAPEVREPETRPSRPATDDLQGARPRTPCADPEPDRTATGSDDRDGCDECGPGLICEGGT